MKPLFEKRKVKGIGLSVDPADAHEKWIQDINETQNTTMIFPILAEADRKVSKLNDMLHPNADDTSTVCSFLSPIQIKKYV